MILDRTIVELAVPLTAELVASLYLALHGCAIDDPPERRWPR